MKYPHRDKFWIDKSGVVMFGNRSTPWYAANKWGMMMASDAKSDGLKAGLKVRYGFFTVKSLKEAAGIVRRDGQWVFLPDEPDQQDLAALEGANPSVIEEDE